MRSVLLTFLCISILHVSCFRLVSRPGNGVEMALAATEASGSSKLGKVISSLLCGAVVLIGNPSAMVDGQVNMLSIPSANAAVGEGGLPQGVMAFQKLVKFQKDLDNVAGSARTRGSEMDNGEIQQLKIFMKQLSNEYSDMEFLAKGIGSESDREAAKKVGKELRAVAREVDNALSDGKTEVLTEKYPVMKKQISDFLQYLQDVPDEL